MPRRPMDFYATADWMVEELLRRVTPFGAVFECCAGAGDIAEPLRRRGHRVITNDLDATRACDSADDARNTWLWERTIPDWTITNPPFKVATPIVENALRYSRAGVAMLLRLTWLEPTRDRADLLGRCPPTKLIVLPRYSFTGDGKTDSVTCAWMVWERKATGTISVAPRRPESHQPAPRREMPVPSSDPVPF